MTISAKNLCLVVGFKLLEIGAYRIQLNSLSDILDPPCKRPTAALTYISSI